LAAVEKIVTLTLKWPPGTQEPLMAMQHSPILLCTDSDSDDNWRYMGGVNVYLDSELEEDRDGSDE
jgi:hypothetical protein